MTKEKVTYMYVKSESLPDDGWLQHCIICDNITGNTYDFIKSYCCSSQKIRAYICKRCLKDSKNIERINKLSIKFL